MAYPRILNIFPCVNIVELYYLAILYIRSLQPPGLMIWGEADVVIIEKCTINVMGLSHPKTVPSPPQCMEKLSPTKSVSGAKKVGDHCYV